MLIKYLDFFKARSYARITREFVPRFRRLENRSLSHFRSRLVASLTGILRTHEMASYQLV